ncbi:MAG: hypothetical protein JXM75_13030 [Chromatiaceae bacterium]|nr:hypothetical protein [Chromatiaceae bacterium]
MSDNTDTSTQRKPNYRMTLMRRQAWSTLAYGGDLTTVSTTGLWEAARKAHKEGQPSLLASAFMELFERCEQDRGRPVRLRVEYPEPVSDTTAADTDLPTLTDADVSDTPAPAI